MRKQEREIENSKTGGGGGEPKLRTAFASAFNGYETNND